VNYGAFSKNSTVTKPSDPNRIKIPPPPKKNFLVCEMGKEISKAVPVLNQIPRHEDVWRVEV